MTFNKKELKCKIFTVKMVAITTQNETYSKNIELRHDTRQGRHMTQIDDKQSGTITIYVSSLSEHKWCPLQLSTSNGTETLYLLSRHGSTDLRPLKIKYVFQMYSS